MRVDGTNGADGLVTRSVIGIDANPRRVLARLFVPGHELVGDEQSRATGVLARILALPEDVIAATVDRILARYAGRHRDLSSTLLEHYERIAHRVPDGASLSPERRHAIGACFTHEFAIEGAALFNPAAVPHPDQSGLAPVSGSRSDLYPFPRGQCWQQAKELGWTKWQSLPSLQPESPHPGP